MGKLNDGIKSVVVWFFVVVEFVGALGITTVVAGIYWGLVALFVYKILKLFGVLN